MSNELLAATYGRGAYVITLKPGSVPGGATSGVLPARGGRKSGHLAATGAPVGLAVLALVLLGSGLAVRRRVG